MHDGAARASAPRELIGRQRAGTTPLVQLFAPLDHLLQRGGDTRLQIDPATGTNQYGCRAAPDADVLSFASSTATSISERAFRRLEEARDNLMRSAIAVGIESAFDLRMEEMRHDLVACLGLRPEEVDVVFSPSGTDSQLHALFLAQAWLGGSVTTVVVAVDQTGSGTAFTSRGQHFSALAASGRRVAKGAPIDGMPPTRSVAIPLLDADGRFLAPADSDAAVLAAVAAACAAGDNVLLQIMDASKFGWHAPSDGCLDAIMRRWPGRVQIVVDACQLRLGRQRLKQYLDRQYAVIVTGSKFFTGPGFSGALLIPAGLGRNADLARNVPQSLADYASRSDWPWAWQTLRMRFATGPNFGQWLRWEAALEEMRDYYATPATFRRAALVTFGRAIERLIGASPSLRLLPLRQDPADVDNEEFDQPTIFPFLVRRDGHDFGLDACTRLYRALAAANRQELTGDLAAVRCLIGQPVALGVSGKAALRICAGARLVTETWSPDGNVARANLQREIERVETVVDKLEWLLADPARLAGEDTQHGA